MAADSIFTASNALAATRMGAGFIPGGNAVKAGLVAADAGLAFAQGNIDSHVMSDEEYKRLSVMLEADLRNEAKHSRSLKGALGKMRENYTIRPWTLAISALVAGGVGLAVTIGVSAIATPVVGFIAGGIASIAAGFITDKVIDSVFPSKHETPVEVATQLRAKQMNGQAIAPEEAFVTLAGSLRHKDKEKIREDLHKLTGYRSMGAALEAGEHAALRKLMRKYDNFIRAETGLLTDMNNPEMTASEQYAQAINAGQLDARFLLFHDRLPVEVNIPAMEQYTGMGHLPSPELPSNHRGGPAL